MPKTIRNQFNKYLTYEKLFYIEKQEENIENTYFAKT